MTDGGAGRGKQASQGGPGEGRAGGRAGAAAISGRAIKRTAARTKPARASRPRAVLLHADATRATAGRDAPLEPWPGGRMGLAAGRRCCEGERSLLLLLARSLARCPARALVACRVGRAIPDRAGGLPEAPVGGAHTRVVASVQGAGDERVQAATSGCSGCSSVERARCVLLRGLGLPSRARAPISRPAPHAGPRCGIPPQQRPGDDPRIERAGARETPAPPSFSSSSSLRHLMGARRRDAQQPACAADSCDGRAATSGAGVCAAQREMC